MSRTLQFYLYDKQTGKPLMQVRGEAFRTDTGASAATATSDSNGLLQFTGMADDLTYKVMAYLPGDVRVFDEREAPQWHYLTTPLTSASWDGDAHSTTASTLIDLSAVFGVPAGVKAVTVRLVARDSAAWGTAGLYAGLNGANDVVKSPVFARPAGGDVWVENAGIVPCNTDGDIYFACVASGASTMDVIIEIYGYAI